MLSKVLPQAGILDQGKSIARFYLVIVLTIGVNYYLPSVVKYFFFISIFYVYYRSKDEAFWLAFFFAVSDGVFGFLGKYEVIFEVIPGLPGVEIGQIYVILSILKARLVDPKASPFFGKFLIVLAIYLIFLMAQGHIVGISHSLNVQFRLIKQVMPFLLFYSLPRLFRHESQYIQVLFYLFPIAIMSLGTQIFTILKSTSTMDFFGAKEEYRHKILINLDVNEEGTYRGIYNEYILLITYFGSLFMLAIKSKYATYLYLVVICIFFSYFLSATRGYVLGFTVILFLFLIFISQLKFSTILTMSFAAIAIFAITRTIPVVELQMTHAFNRMLTLESLVEGDVTAGGTLKRIDVRSPRVMKKWRESPLTGWGFSNTFYEYSDMHVANQNLLMHSGIVGGILMLSFFIYFNMKILLRSWSLSRDNPYKKGLLVFVIFFIGWFLIHSSTQYFFSYYFQCMGVALLIITFFCFGGLMYRRSLEKEEELTPSDALVMAQ